MGRVGDISLAGGRRTGLSPVVGCTAGRLVPGPDGYGIAGRLPGDGGGVGRLGSDGLPSGVCVGLVSSGLLSDIDVLLCY